MWEILLEWKITISLICVVLLFLYISITSNLRYFEKRGIPYIPGNFIFGSDIKATLLKVPLGLSNDEFYQKKKNEKILGYFIGPKPFLLVNDPDYVQRVLISDFEYFHDRGFEINEKANPLNGHLFFLNGNKWKLLRILLTPVFTSAKLRFMLPEMVRCADLLMDHFNETVQDGDTELKDIFRRFAMDVIASSAFGLEPESIKNPHNQFRKMGTKVFEPSVKQSFIQFLLFAAPKLVPRLNLSLFPNECHVFFYKLINDMFSMRRKTNYQRKDFIHLILELKGKTNEIDEKENNGELKALEKVEITDDVLAAQCFVFLLAGYETTSDALSYTTYFLSKNKDAQEKARSEVQRVSDKFNGEFSYEAIKEMNYLEMCITEALRLLPPVPQLNRVVVKDYTFPNGMKVSKGLNVMIPVYSIHRDPRYFKEPERYNPDRYLENDIPKGVFQTFGDGPRHCIGKRFGLLEIKLILAKLLLNYNLEESKLTKEPLEFLPVIQLTPVNPLYVKLIKINK